MNKILIVEDDTDINNLLAKIMKKQGYSVVQAFSGTEAHLRLGLDGTENTQLGEYSLILLDLMLPGMMGEEVLAQIRKVSEVPVIILSARSGLEDRVKLLNMGADDYLVKPFEKDEVIARAGGAIRRYHRYRRLNTASVEGEPAGMPQEADGQECATPVATDDILQYKQLVLHLGEREALLNGQAMSLTGHEFDILCLLMRNQGKVFSRENLYEEIWRGGYYGEDNTVNMHISNLRKKIAAVVEEEYIKTVWGIGYKLV
ncbi:MAG: response regulator transcription factor [Lachnospiraceae bacterium]|nr:response regulator transcription factor [Lachnospiraceae bacterium]